MVVLFFSSLYTSLQTTKRKEQYSMATPVAAVAIGRNLTLTLVSAENLVDVRRLGKLKVYAKVSLDELPGTVSKSDPDREGRTNPIWNFNVDYMISQEALQRQPEIKIVVELKCARSLGENRYVGRVRIGLRELLEKGMSFENHVLSYDVEDCPNGRLHVMYRFSEPGPFILPPQIQTTTPNERVRPALDVANTILEYALVVFNGTMFFLNG